MRDLNNRRRISGLLAVFESVFVLMRSGSFLKRTAIEVSPPQPGEPRSAKNPPGAVSTSNYV
jgi:hypothetical protein